MVNDQEKRNVPINRHARYKSQLAVRWRPPFPHRPRRKTEAVDCGQDDCRVDSAVSTGHWLETGSRRCRIESCAASTRRHAWHANVPTLAEFTSRLPRSHIPAYMTQRLQLQQLVLINVREELWQRVQFSRLLRQDALPAKLVNAQTLRQLHQSAILFLLLFNQQHEEC